MYCASPHANLPLVSELLVQHRLSLRSYLRFHRQTLMPCLCALLEQFRELETGDECPESRGFFNKLKDALGG